MLWGLLFWAVHAAFAADLAIPKSRVPPVVHYAPPIARIPKASVPLGTSTSGSPLAAPELCLRQSGKEPYPGQTLQHDESCPTKLRWVKQKK